MIVRQDRGFDHFYKIVAAKFRILFKNYPVMAEVFYVYGIDFCKNCVNSSQNWHVMEAGKLCFWKIRTS